MNTGPKDKDEMARTNQTLLKRDPQKEDTPFDGSSSSASDEEDEEISADFQEKSARKINSNLEQEFQKKELELILKIEKLGEKIKVIIIY
jgi:hypothetical protein